MKWLEVLRDAVVEVLVVPVREGTLRPGTWPVGLGPVMALAGAGYLTAMVLVLGAGVIRRLDRPIIIDGSQVIGAATMTLLIWLVGLTLALGLTAALHVHVMARLAALTMLLMPLVPLLLAPQRGWMALVGAAGIVIVFLIRSRRRFAAWEFPVIWVLVCIGLLGPLRWEVNYGYDQRTHIVLLVLTFMNSLAIPGLMVVGYTASQVSVSLGQWVGTSFAEVLSRRAVSGLMWLLVVVNVGYAAISTIRGRPDWAPANWVGSLALVVVATVIIMVLRRAVPDLDRNPNDPGEPGVLDEGWVPLAFLMAAIVLAPMLLGALTVVARGMTTLITGSSPGWMTDVANHPLSVALLRFAQAVLACIIGWRRARGGDQASPMVLGAYAAIMVLAAVSIPTAWAWLAWEAEQVGLILLIVLVIITFTRGGTSGYGHGLVLGFVVSLYRFREVLSDPMAVFAMVSAFAVLLLSLLWRVLTDAELTHGDSKTVPRPSRVLTYATLCLLSAITLAVGAQLRIVGSPLDQTLMIVFGDRTLGGALFVAAGLASLLAMRRARMGSQEAVRIGGTTPATAQK